MPYTEIVLKGIISPLNETLEQFGIFLKKVYYCLYMRYPNSLKRYNLLCMSDVEH